MPPWVGMTQSGDFELGHIFTKNIHLHHPSGSEEVVNSNDIKNDRLPKRGRKQGLEEEENKRQGG